MPFPSGLSSPFAEQQLKRLTPEDVKAQMELRRIEEETVESTGTIFVSPEQVVVKPPLLTALISISKTRSPLMIDADSATEINLGDVLKTALASNLAIKIVQADSQKQKWQYVGALSGFLPNLSNAVGFQGLTGSYASPAGLAIGIRNRYLTTANSFTQNLFQGGSVLFGAMQNKHQYKASQFALKGTTNDVLFDATALYYNLVLNEALLQIRVKAVEVSKALVLVNEDLFNEGVNTQLDVLQAKYQLSSDRQQLIAQQVARRQAAVNLAAALNLDTGVDFALKNRSIAKVRLVDANLQPLELIKLAIDNRPELKRYEQLRLAAKDAIKVAQAAFFPTVSTTGTIIGTGTKASSASLQSLTQQTPLSSSGVGIGSISSAGGLPLAVSNQPAAHFTTRALYTIGINVQWTLGGLALSELAQVQSARYEARKVQLEFNRELERVRQQVRDAYLASISAENLIDETTDAVKYAEEGLRLASLKFREGVGTYLDVINAQRNYTDSLINKASAIIKFNVSQAQLLQAIGRISYNSLTSLAPLRQ